MPDEQNKAAYYITGSFANFDGKEENLTAKLEIKITNQNFQAGNIEGLLHMLGAMYARTYLELDAFFESACNLWEYKDGQWVMRDGAEGKTPQLNQPQGR